MSQKLPPRKKANKPCMTFLKNTHTIHGTNHLQFLEGTPLRLWVSIMLGTLLITIAFVVLITNKFNAFQIVTQVKNSLIL